MSDRVGFAKPMDEVGMIFQPGILSMAWGSVVRQIAAGLDITLDEPLTEEVDRRPAARDTESVGGEVKQGTMGAVKFAVVGKVDGTPRVVLEHHTRTDPEQVPEWDTPRPGGARRGETPRPARDGCCRSRIPGAPVMQVDFTQRGDGGARGVSDMPAT